MVLEKAFDDALKALRTTGGVVTVVLGRGVDAPSEWSWHPRVHWLVSSELRKQMVPSAIPTNTRLMLLTDNISGDVYQPIHNERKRRRLPYMIRHTGDAVAEQLKEIFPTKMTMPANVERDEPFSPALPQEALVNITEAPSNGNGSNGNGNGHHAADDTGSTRGRHADEPPRTTADGKRRMAEKGSIKKFLEEHANLSAATSNAEEGRRLFRIAIGLGIETTRGSLEQGVRQLKRAKSIGSRPESLVAPAVQDAIVVSNALEEAIKVLTAAKDRFEKMEQQNEALVKENGDLRARITLMKDAFAGM